MSLFKVVPELRSLGVQVQLAAWYPWRVKGSEEPMADSCGIFMCVPCAAEPNMGMNIFHDAWWTLDEHENGGPGQTLSTYLPKTADTETIVEASLGPAVADIPQKGKDKGKGKGNGTPNQREGNQREGLCVRAKHWTHLRGGTKETA